MTAGENLDLGAVIVAAGVGQRFGNDAKVFSLLGGRPVLAYSLDLFAGIPEVQQIVVVLGSHTLEVGQTLVENAGITNATVCLGGASRSDSVRAGLRALSADIGLVAVHDAARPCARREVVQRVIAVARGSGAAIPVLKVTDTIQRVNEHGQVIGIEPRDSLRCAQTPQVARRDWLQKALGSASAYSDEGGALVAAGYPVMTVDGSSDNIKLTWREDLALAEAILRGREG